MLAAAAVVLVCLAAAAVIQPQLVALGVEALER
jgi:hypothetical protein